MVLVGSEQQAERIGLALSLAATLVASQARRQASFAQLCKARLDAADALTGLQVLSTAIDADDAGALYYLDPF